MKTTKKELTQEQVMEIGIFISNDGYLKKTDVILFREKFKFSLPIFQREMIKNKIPYESGNSTNILHSFGIKIENKKIEYTDFLILGDWRNILFKNSKIVIRFNCIKCNFSGESVLSKMLNRIFLSSEPICSKCIYKSVSNLPEVIKRNSDSQLIAQNKPETKEKNRQSQITRYKDLEVLRKHSESGKIKWQNKEYREKMTKIAKEKWDNPEYARKVIENSKNGGLKGRYKEIYYDSSYELAWMLKKESEGNFNKIKRANLYINYKKNNGKTSHYYPDFIYDNDYLIEIKGYGPWVNLDDLSRKNLSAKKWCKENNMKYRLLGRTEISDFWIRIARKKHKELQDGKIKK